MSNWFLKLAVLSFLGSVALGLYMGISQQHSHIGSHAHVALMGWVSMTLFALAYRLWPVLDGGWLVRAHFWLYTLGFVVTAVGLVLLDSGRTARGDPLAGIGSMLNALGVVCFAARVLRTDLATARG